MDRKKGKSFSWNVIDEKTVMKNGDKSFFEYNDTGIPKDIKWFFDAKEMAHGDSKEIVMTYMGKNYMGRLYIDPLQRCRLTWESLLGKQLKKRINLTDDNYPEIWFHREGKNKFILECVGDPTTQNEELKTDEKTGISKEGRKVQYIVSKYERDPEVRRNAIQIHGSKCMICGFDFEDFYGETGKGFIEVHHLKPLSEIGEEVDINPLTDVICVCSNCHRIIHRKADGTFNPDEVREMIRDKKIIDGLTRREVLRVLENTQFSILWPEDDWDDLGFTEHPIWINQKGYGYFLCDEPNIFYEAERIPDEKWNIIRKKIEQDSLSRQDIEGTSLSKMAFFEDEELIPASEIMTLLSLPEHLEHSYYCGQSTVDGTLFFYTKKDFLGYFERDYADYEWSELDDNHLIEWYKRLKNSDYGSGNNFFEIV